MRNLYLRIITAVVLLPIVIGAFIAGGLSLDLLLGIVCLISCLEISQIILPNHALARLLAVVFWLGTFVAAVVNHGFSFLFLSFLMLMIMNCIILFLPIERHNFEKFSAIFFWSFYASFAIICIHWLAQINGTVSGISFVVLACIATWSNDTFAYIGGRLFGKHPLFKNVSAKKTWEGFVSGALGTALVFTIIALCFQNDAGLFRNLTTCDFLFIGIPSMALAPLGDLIESRLKRLYDTKDSSQILPGHGGLLDRIDGLLTVIPWTALYAFIIRPMC